MKNATASPLTATFIADQTIVSNEKACEHWDKILLQDIPLKFDIKNKLNLMTITFKYKTLKKKNLLEKILSKDSTEEKEFTLSHVRGLEIFRKGYMMDSKVIDTPILCIYITKDEEKEFLLNEPVDDKGEEIPETCVKIPGGGLSKVINIQFIDIVSMTVTEDGEKIDWVK